MRIVLVGSGGMLGRSLHRAFDAMPCELTAAPGRPHFDITDARAVAGVAPPGTTHVVNAAAFTAVDAAESEPGQAMRANGVGPGVLAEHCRSIGATLVHFSTDYVFGGSAEERPAPLEPAPIRPAAVPRPLNVYGLSKLAGERAIRSSGCRALILRTSWLFAAHGTSFVRSILELAGTRDLLHVVDDQRGRPTSCPELARQTVRLMEAGATGTLHACCGGEASWYDLACAVVSASGRPCAVEPCSTRRFPRPARRAGYGVLDLGDTIALVGEPRPWTAAVQEVVAELAG